MFDMFVLILHDINKKTEIFRLVIGLSLLQITNAGITDKFYIASARLRLFSPHV